MTGTNMSLLERFMSMRPRIAEVNMSRRVVAVAVVCLLWPAMAQAAQTGGNSPSGTNFSCDGSICSCDNSYIDCKAMQPYCRDDNVNCQSGRCTCRMKNPSVVGRNPSPTKPKPGTPARIPSTAPVKEQ